MSAPTKNNLILPPPSPSWFGSVVHFVPKPHHTLTGWFKELQDFGKELEQNFSNDKSQRYKHDYEIWRRTGGYKSSVVDLSMIEVSPAEINTLIAIKTEDTVQEQLDTKAETEDLGSMAYQNSTDIDVTGGEASGVDVKNGTIEGAAITDSTIDVSCTVDIQAGGGGIICNTGGVIDVDTTTNSSTGVGETDLTSFTVPANTCNTDNDILEYLAFGDFAANANNKTVRVYLDGTCIFTSSTVPVTSNWVLKGTIIRTSSTSALCEGAIEWNRNIDYQESATPAAIDFTSASILKITGQGGANNDVQQYGMITKWFGSHI